MCRVSCRSRPDPVRTFIHPRDLPAFFYFHLLCFHPHPLLFQRFLFLPQTFSFRFWPETPRSVPARKLHRISFLRKLFLPRPDALWPDLTSLLLFPPELLL